VKESDGYVIQAARKMIHDWVEAALLHKFENIIEYDERMEIVNATMMNDKGTNDYFHNSFVDNTITE